VGIGEVSSLIFGDIIIITIITFEIDVTPLAVFVDQNPRMVLSNLVHACAWRFRLFCGVVIFSDCVVSIMPLIIMFHCCE
jgi:hypothetical protein